MRYSRIILFFCIIIVTRSETRRHEHNRIIGGEDVAPKEIPYQVSLRILKPNGNNDHSCGGAILTKHWILSAAHCFIKCIDLGIEYCPFVVGTIYSELQPDTLLHPGQFVIPHEEFNMEPIVNDIGLYRSKYSIEFNDYVQPIPLMEFIVPDNSRVMATGWGRIAPILQIAPSILQKITVNKLNFDRCNRMWQRAGRGVVPGNLCTISEQGAGMCYGDSGGPLVYNGYLAGVVSWGVDGCARGYPDVFSDVRYYKNWIESKMYR